MVSHVNISQLAKTKLALRPVTVALRENNKIFERFDRGVDVHSERFH